MLLNTSRHLDSENLHTTPFVLRSNYYIELDVLITIHIFICLFLIYGCLITYIIVFSCFKMLYSYCIVFFCILMQLAFCFNIMLGNKIVLMHVYSGCSGMLLRFSFRSLRIEPFIPSVALSWETFSRDCLLQELTLAKHICLAPGYSSPGATTQ